MRRLRSLATGEQFAAVFRRGRAYFGSVVVVRVLPNGLDQSQLGLVVGKKVGGAVDRNRAKRRIRQIVYGRALTPGWDVVVIARSGIHSAKFRDLEHELGHLLERARIVGANCVVDNPADSVIPEDRV
jgi:ribonuclease P protein component